MELSLRIMHWKNFTVAIVYQFFKFGKKQFQRSFSRCFISREQIWLRLIMTQNIYCI